RYKADNTFAEYLPDLNFSENDKAVFNYLISNVPNSPALEKEAGRLFTKLKLMAAERGALIEAGYNKPIPIIGAKTIHKQVNRKATDQMTEKLLSIISNRQWMDITYMTMNAGEYHPYYRLFPIVLFVWHGDAYVYALNRHEALLMLALERFKSIDRVFEDKVPEKEYDINSLLSDPFGIMYDTEPFDVKLQLSQMEATYEKQKEWPESVSFEDCKDGTSIMKAKTHDLFDCRRWILARIPSVKVIEPLWLKEDIRKTIEKALVD
ncbi:MAG: WYL domain-containing protein, partial [Spirochaetales bacterium]|nr:WYL domain-containing protein [Spirochaetales bacterium]